MIEMTLVFSVDARPRLPHHALLVNPPAEVQVVISCFHLRQWMKSVGIDGKPTAAPASARTWSMRATARMSSAWS
jgi:hypothetical protein